MHGGAASGYDRGYGPVARRPRTLSRPAPAPDAPLARGLLSRLTHALGTPLGSVQISAELLAQDPDGRLGERELRLIDNVRRATAEVQELLRQVGRLVKAREGRLHLFVEEVAVDDLAGELDRRLAAAHAGRAAVHLGPTAAAARVVADRTVLVEVVETLAAALLPPGVETGGLRVEVAIEGEAGGDGGAAATIVVVGTGGAARIGEADFEPLADAGGAGATLGLRLALARELIAAQGGGLAVDEADEGTVLRVVLPLAG